MRRDLSSDTLGGVFRLLSAGLARRDAPPIGLVVCGGAALIATGLRRRTTVDVDVVALMGRDGKLISPVPLPAHLIAAANGVAQEFHLPPDWLNNGPSRDEGGLFQMGLPAGFQDRLHPRDYGTHLTVHFIDRLDQIHFKLYAAVDRGGYHISDLEALHPTDDELAMAARWAMTHDVSEGFRALLRQLLESLGHVDAAACI
jgi:hypothetical protein